MTPDDLRARLDVATPGPWSGEERYNTGWRVLGRPAGKPYLVPVAECYAPQTNDEANAALIVAAVNALPLLLDLWLARLERRRADAEWQRARDDHDAALAHDDVDAQDDAWQRVTDAERLAERFERAEGAALRALDEMRSEGMT